MESSDSQPGCILIVGASGLIGSAIAAGLRADGHRVRAVVRSEEGRRRVPADEHITVDLRDALQPADWLPHLAGVTAVVNCAGVLQDSPRDSTSAANFRGPAALFDACAQAGVGRVIHFSALGVGEGGVTPFSRSKEALEHHLESTEVDWVILRPSVVVGRAAYGGSALFRGLASLPVLPRVQGAGRISVVQLEDVAETVRRLVRADTPSRVTIDLAGPEALEFEQVVAHYRRWLGWPPARVIRPMPLLMAAAYRLGDMAGAFGWRPPIRTTAEVEIRRGAAASTQEWTALTGVEPARLEDALAREPASVQERWFSRLYFLKPLAIAVFAFFWILTGVVSLGPGYDIGLALMREGGAGALSGPSVIAGGLADIAIGLALLWRRTARLALFAALAITIFYVLAGTAILPRLWEEPLGPMMKVWPILALNLILFAILDER